jgi:hypothetical protein
MAHKKDWMPSSIQGRIDMGRNWVNILKNKGTAWRVSGELSRASGEFSRPSGQVPA